VILLLALAALFSTTGVGLLRRARRTRTYSARLDALIVTLLAATANACVIVLFIVHPPEWKLLPSWCVLLLAGMANVYFAYRLVDEYTTEEAAQ